LQLTDADEMAIAQSIKKMLNAYNEKWTFVCRFKGNDSGLIMLSPVSVLPRGKSIDKIVKRTPSSAAAFEPIFSGVLGNRIYNQEGQDIRQNNSSTHSEGPDSKV
jgi:hypothetical protein